MGIPSIRLNSGRWGTARDFNHLMELRGKEPILPGHTEEEGFRWCIDSIEKCLPQAQKHGVHLALENHWGLTRTPEGLLRIAQAIDSPWLASSWTPEILWRTLRQAQKIAPFTTFVQAKTYFGGGEWYTLDLDYPRIAKILSKSATTDNVSIEFEGKALPGKACFKASSFASGFF